MNFIKAWAARQGGKLLRNEIMKLLEAEKGKIIKQNPGSSKYLDVLNSGILVDLDRVKLTSINIAMETLEKAYKNFESNTKDRF